jgi:hypothetical protein
MRLAHFNIQKIGPMWPHGRSSCEVLVSVRNDDSDVTEDITVNVSIEFRDTESLDTVRTRILSESLRALKEAATLLDGKTLQSLSEISDDDYQERERIRMARWEASDKS